jgi:adenylate kinase family enzyme
MRSGSQHIFSPRNIIIGNSGSGKTYLAQTLSNNSVEVFHLDTYFWEPGGFNKKRAQDVVTRELVAISTLDEWIVEGVFGELIELFLERASCFVWLDLDWDTCRKNLIGRGSESSQQLDASTAEKNFQTLLDWASKYWKRTNSRSHSGHQKLFDRFPRQKYQLTSKKEVSKWLLVRSTSYNSSELPKS